MTPYYEHAGITIYHGDCREILPQLPKFDLLLTDPPYGIDACNMTLGTGRKRFIRGDWDLAAPDIRSLLGCADRCCIWGGNYFANVLPPNNHWLVWHKINDGLSFSECELAWTNYGKNVRHLSHHWSGEIKMHPTQKPLSVMKWALSFCPEARSVVDPYCGAGTSLVAAKDAGAVAIGIELEERYCEIAAKRLSQEVMAFA